MPTAIHNYDRGSLLSSSLLLQLRQARSVLQGSEAGRLHLIHATQSTDRSKHPHLAFVLGWGCEYYERKGGGQEFPPLI